jgi:hypothetical protein
MRLAAHFGHWLEVGRRGRKVRQWQVATGLIYGQVKKNYRRRKLLRVTHVMRLGTQADLTVARASDGLLWSAEHRFYRASESDSAPWGGSTGSPHMGHRSAVPTTAGCAGYIGHLFRK